jgi:hypothetical protein
MECYSQTSSWTTSRPPSHDSLSVSIAVNQSMYLNTEETKSILRVRYFILFSRLVIHLSYVLHRFSVPRPPLPRCPTMRSDSLFSTTTLHPFPTSRESILSIRSQLKHAAPYPTPKPQAPTSLSSSMECYSRTSSWTTSSSPSHDSLSVLMVVNRCIQILIQKKQKVLYWYVTSYFSLALSYI